jgi:hypothetical protein
MAFFAGRLSLRDCEKIFAFARSGRIRKVRVAALARFDIAVGKIPAPQPRGQIPSTHVCLAAIIAGRVVLEIRAETA